MSPDDELIVNDAHAPDFSSALAEYKLEEAAIAEMAEMYMSLKVDGVEDREGLAVVHEARMKVKNRRVEVEKVRVRLKAPALAFERAIDGRATELKAQLLPIENHLLHEETKVVEEKKRLKEAAAKALAELLADRMRQLSAVGSHLGPTEVELMDGKRFDAALKSETIAYEARVAAEEEAQLKEIAAQKALDAERAAKEEEHRLALVASERRLAAEREKLAVEKAEAAKVAKRLREEENQRLEEARDRELAAAAEKRALEAERETVRLERLALAEEQAGKERDEAQERERESREKAAALKKKRAAAKHQQLLEERKPQMMELVDYGRAVSEVPVPFELWCTEDIIEARDDFLAVLAALQRGEVL